MSQKIKLILITLFILTGLILTFFYFSAKNIPVDIENKEVPFYQRFNPFIKDINPKIDQGDPTTTNDPTIPGGEENRQSKFYQITDFAIAGATFFEDSRLIDKNELQNSPTPQIEEIKTIINPTTKEGRKEIQIILNESLSLNPPLVVDGVFGNKALLAIKEFQKINNLPQTGKIDAETNPYFTKTTTSTINPEEDLYENAPSVRFVERMNGHIYKMFLDTKIKEKISNSTITTIYEAFFNSRADTVIYRYLSDDNTISSLIMKIGSTNKDFLPQNITDMTISSDKTKFFYLVKNNNGSTGVMGNFDDKKESVVFSSPFTEWLPQWTNYQNIFLTTKPYYGATGSIFLLNTINKTTSKVFGGITGITTLSNSESSNILYSFSTETGPKLNVFDKKKHKSIDLDTYGLPEKCIWGNDDINIYCAVPNTVVGNQYPNYWYQGLISFDDFFVKINTNTNEKETLANSKFETPIDGTNLFLSKDEDKLFFTNKKDGTLWSLDL